MGAKKVTPFTNPFAKALKSFEEAAAATKKMTAAQIDADWDARQRQRAASGTNIHVPTLYLVSRVSGKIVKI